MFITSLAVGPLPPLRGNLYNKKLVQLIDWIGLLNFETWSRRLTSSNSAID